MKKSEPGSIAGAVVGAGTSDSRYFRAKGIVAYGIAPFKVNYYDADTVHGNDERIRARFFSEGVRLRSEEHTSELQSQSNLVCRLLLEKKKNTSEVQPQSNLVCRLLLEKKQNSQSHQPQCEHDHTNGGYRIAYITPTPPARQHQHARR